MANELAHRYSLTGRTLYATIRSVARTYWNTSGTPALETLTVANWANYAVALTETPSASYFYVGTWPAGLTTVGWYWIDIYERIGGTAAISDTLVATYYGYWDGTTLQPNASDLQTIKTQAITCGAGVTVAANVGTASASTAQSGDSYAKITDGTYGLAQLVRSTTPGNTLSVDSANKVAVPDTQKVDVNTVKTQTVGCSAGVTVNPNIGTTQPINFTGTGSTAYVKAGLWEILGTVLTETSGYIAAAFKKLFNVQSPTWTTDATIGTSTFAGGAVASVTSPVALTSAYDAAKTAAAPGDKMDLIDAPNNTALAATATAIWAKATSALSAAGSIGKWLLDNATGGGASAEDVLTAIEGSDKLAMVDTPMTLAAGQTVENVNKICGYVVAPLDALPIDDAATDIAGKVLDEGKGDHTGHLAGVPTVGTGAGQIKLTNGLVESSNAGGSPVGPGGVETEIICEAGGTPVQGVECWISGASDGTNVVAGPLVSNALGKVKFMLELNSGPWCLWRQKSGATFANPQTLVWNAVTNQYELDA